jgi:hypothetical protein
MLGERTVLFGVFAGRGPGRVARNRLESFTQFSRNENCHRRCVPHQLTDDLPRVRIAKCSELLRALEAMQRTHFQHITTPQAMKAGLTSNTSMPDNDRSLAMKWPKEWTRLSAPLSLSSRLFWASTASIC